MTTSRRESLETFRAVLAHRSNSTSCVTPRSSVIASNFLRPTVAGLVSGEVLSTPATYLPSHLIRNLKFLYGSNRLGLRVNSVRAAPRVWRLDRYAHSRKTLSMPTISERLQGTVAVTWRGACTRRVRTS